MSRTLYILFSGRFPSEKAAAIHVAESARSFSLHLSVCIIAPRRRGRGGDAHGYYDLPEAVRVVYLPTIDLFGVPGPRSIAFHIGSIVFAVCAWLYLKLHSGAGDIYLANDMLPGFAASLNSGRLIYEVHDFPESHARAYGFLFDKAYKILGTNRWKKEELSRRFPGASSKLLMERNGVDLKVFGTAIPTREARRRLTLPEEGVLAVYAGHLYSWKGVDTLLDAAAAAPSISVALVGGTEEDVQRYSAQYAQHSSIRFFGHRPHTEIPLWHAAADMLILPNTAKEDISLRYTSPMKLFEYMASGKPIIASSIPSIREILDDDMCTYFTPDSAESLATAIQDVIADRPSALMKAERAKRAIEDGSWEKRAARILESL